MSDGEEPVAAKLESAVSTVNEVGRGLEDEEQRKNLQKAVFLIREVAKCDRKQNGPVSEEASQNVKVQDQ